MRVAFAGNRRGIGPTVLLLFCVGVASPAVAQSSPSSPGSAAPGFQRPTGAASRSVPSALELGLAPISAPLPHDTLLHGIAGAMSALFVASIAAQAYGQPTIDRYPFLLPAIGVSAALVAGIAKETVDSTGFGDPQWSDIVHTVFGGALAAGVVALIEVAPGGTPPPIRAQSALYAGLGAGLALPIAAGLVQEVELYLAKRRLQR